MSDIIDGFDIGDLPTEYSAPYWIYGDFSIYGDVGYLGDPWDRFAFVAPSNGVATFTLFDGFANFFGDVNLVLEDQFGNVVASSSNGPAFVDFIQVTLERGKVYYVDIWSYSTTYDTYRLDLDFAEVPLLIGSAGNDTLSGTAVDENLFGDTGNDRLVGGGGLDTAYYDGLSSQYRFGVLGAVVTVRDNVPAGGNEGTDRISSTEVLRFNDREFYLSGSGDTLKLSGTPGDDTIDVAGGGTLAVDGRGGRDIAVFRGNAADYAFSLSDATVTVRDLNPIGGDDGVRLLTGFETLRFADRDLEVTGGEFRVNSTTIRDQLLPAVAGLENGQYVVTWASSGGDNGIYGIYAQRYSAGGVRLGPELHVNTNTSAFQQEPDIAALDNGNFVVVWSLRGSNGAGSSIQAQRYDASGNTLGGPITANTATAGYEISPSVAALPGGGFVIAWATSETNDTGFEIHSRRFAASGAAIGSELQANTSETGQQFGTSVTALAGGGFVVSWLSIDGATVPSTWFQRYSANGAAAGVNRQVASSSDPVNQAHAFDPANIADILLTDVEFAPKIEALSDGGFVVASTWLDISADFVGTSLHFFNANGTVRGPPRVVSNDGGFMVAMTVLADDTVVVAWPALGADDYLDMYSRRFSPNGTPLGPAVLVNSTTYDNQGIGAVEALNGGGYVVAWTSAGQDLSENGVYAQQYEDNGDTVSVEVRGTDGADVLFYIGDDAMQAFGFEGDDIYLVERAEDQAIEAPGEGTDTVKANLSWTLAGNLEDLVLTSTADDSGTGNGLANRITGNEGANTINGAAGADTMTGGDGDDTYYVNVAGDNVIESASASALRNRHGGPLAGGSNIDTVISQVSYTLSANVENLMLSGTASIAGTGNELDNLMTGGEGANRLLGRGGVDLISGGKGNDTVGGGDNNDTIEGGGNRDQFLFDRALGANNVDLILDFVPLIDRIGLDDDIFSAGLNAAVPMAPGQLWIGNAAHDADDRIIYRPSNGALYYDPDGNGAAVQVRFATLGATLHPVALTVDDFLIVA